MRTILGIEIFTRPPNGELYFGKYLKKRDFDYTYYTLGTESTFYTLLKAFFAPRRLSKYDIIITTDYFSSFAINLRLLVTGARSKHVTIGLNQSRSLLIFRVKIINQLINSIFRRADLIIAHSRREIALFSDKHEIPKEKFFFSPWGFDQPVFGRSRFSTWPKKYVCLIGRNNRDIECFIASVSGTDLDGIIVTGRYNVLPRTIPDNIHVFYDLPPDETFDCMKNAAANAILLNDDDRGAGHITAVAAMFEEVPQVVTDAEGIKDYLIDGVTAIMVPFRDPEATRKAFIHVLQEPQLASKLTTNAKEYADRCLTNEKSSERILRAIDELWSEKKALMDDDWYYVFEEFSQKPRLI